MDKKKKLFIFTFQQLLIFEDYKHIPLSLFEQLCFLQCSLAGYTL